MDRRLEYIFGSESRGNTASERAMSSRRVYVRGQDHLALDKKAAIGRRLTAVEALDAYGLDVLQEALDYGSAVLPASEDEPAATLRSRRESLGLSVADVARTTRLSVEEVQDCEDSSTRSPIRHVEGIAIALGLDERKVSVEPGAGGEDQLAVRLKTLGTGPQRLSSTVVATLTEAAWVIRTQARLQKLLDDHQDVRNKFDPSSNYGSPGYPAWQHGYYLAGETRKVLGLDARAPIESIRGLCETMSIPLLQAALPKHIAGATVVSAGVRGIVVNTEEYNRNVWVRRATIAHELGHLLWDPEPQLEMVKVDDYQEIEKLDRDGRDYVEARANAFAIEFLAPGIAVAEVFRGASDRASGLRMVMEQFGLSHTAASYHTWNSLDRPFSIQTLIDACIDSNPTDDWQGRESFTDDYFPLKQTSSLRRGVFSSFVVRAQRCELISLDTACTYLQASEEDYQEHADSIASLFLP